MVLARLITPREFGIVGIAMAFIQVLRTFSELGFNAALVQKKDRDKIQESSVFWFLSLAGIIIASFVFLVAPGVAAYYQEAELTFIVRSLSLYILVFSFSIVPFAILRKELDFRSLAIRVILSESIAGVVAVALAYFGYGVWALVVKQILALTIATLVMFGASRFKPMFVFQLSKVRSLLPFSFFVFAAQSVNSILIQFESLAIGRVFTPTTLGFYSRATSVNSLLNRNAVTSISNVFMPTLSKVQDDPERFRNGFLRVFSVVAFTASLLTTLVFVNAKDLVLLLFGAQWIQVAPLLQIVILKGASYPLSSITVNAFLAKGKSKKNFYYGNIRKAIQILPFLMLFYERIDWFLYAMLAGSYLNLGLNFYFVQRSLGISVGLQLKHSLPYLITAFFVWGVYLIWLPNYWGISGAVIKSLGVLGLFSIIVILDRGTVLREIMQLYSKYKAR